MSREESVHGGQPRTNALRMVETLGIAVRTLSYEVDEEHLDAVSVAHLVDMDEDQVFKTLVLRGSVTGIFVCCVPGSCEIDLRKAARVSGNKNVDMLPLKELLATTGYQRGGCSPVGMKRHFPIFVDETATLFSEIAVSAGMRGLQMILSPSELLQACGGQYADLIKSGSS